MMDLISTVPFMVFIGAMALLIGTAYWIICKKIGIAGINGIVPVWNSIRLAKETVGGWMATLIGSLYAISFGLVGFAYYRSITSPSTANRMLLLSSLGLSIVILVLEGIVKYRLASGFGKSYIYRVMMYIPGLSTILLWVLALGHDSYLEGHRVFGALGIADGDIYARSGVMGQDRYHMQRVYFHEKKEIASIVEPEIQPIEPVEPYKPEPIEQYQPETVQEHNIEPEMPILQTDEPEEHEVTWEQLDRGEVSYDDLDASNRPLYEGETERPVIIDPDDSTTRALEQAIFLDGDEELRDSVLQFIEAYKTEEDKRIEKVAKLLGVKLPKEEKKKPEPRPEPKPEPKTNTETEIDSILSDMRKKSENRKKSKMVDFSDDFWK